MTRVHRDRVIPFKNKQGDAETGRSGAQKSAIRYAIARKARWFFVVGIGGILTNSYYKVLATKSIYSGPLKSFCLPYMNCHACPFAVASCPIGILQSHAVYRKIPFFLAGFLGTVGLTVGRASCGWLCPFGWVQDTMYKIKSKKIGIPKPFLKLKYVSLAVLAVMLPFFTGNHWFSWICPWGTIIAGIPWVLWNPVNPEMGVPVIEPGMVGWHYALKIAVLLVFLLLFVFTKRPFCRTTCPLGAIYSLFNGASLLQMEVQGECRECNRCKRVCPMDIHVAKEPRSPECIRCLECTVCKGVRVRWRFNRG